MSLFHNILSHSLRESLRINVESEAQAFSSDDALGPKKPPPEGASALSSTKY